MGAHIFVVGQENFKRCLEYGVYGSTKVSFPRVNAEVIAEMETIVPGDFVLFYVKNVGIHGLWKATTHCFLDESIDVWGERGKYPYVFCFEPVIRSFPRPVASNDIFDLRDMGKLWTFDLGVMSNKNHYAITKPEAHEMIRLLLRNNPVARPPEPIAKPYKGTDRRLPIDLSTDRKGQLEYEGYLSAWLVRSLAQGKYKALFGEYDDFLNFVPTSFNNVMDVFLSHVTNIDGIEILHKFTCIELKTKVGTEANLNQIVRYENWLVRKLAGGDQEMVQSVLIAHDFEPAALDYVQKRKKIEEKTVRLIRYNVSKDKDDVELTEVD